MSFTGGDSTYTFGSGIIPEAQTSRLHLGSGNNSLNNAWR